MRSGQASLDARVRLVQPVRHAIQVTRERMVANDREYSRLAAQIRAVILRASEATQGSTRARRDLAIAVGAFGGSRERLDQKEAEGQISQIHAAAGQLDAIKEITDSEDRGSCLPQPRQCRGKSPRLARDLRKTKECLNPNWRGSVASGEMLRRF